MHYFVSLKDVLNYDIFYLSLGPSASAVKMIIIPGAQPLQQNSFPRCSGKETEATAATESVEDSVYARSRGLYLDPIVCSQIYMCPKCTGQTSPHPPYLPPATHIDKLTWRQSTKSHISLY